MKIICMGDSLTEGDYGLPGQSGIANVQPESYPYFLAKHTGWTVVNAGRCGYRATDYWNYLQSGAVSVQDADAIVILLGTNGGNDPDRDTPDNDAYWDILRWCHAHAPAATVFLGTPPHATRNPAMSNCGSGGGRGLLRAQGRAGNRRCADRLGEMPRLLRGKRSRHAA